MEALETDGTTTGAEDLTSRKQHDAINPYAKQTFRARERRAGQNARALSASGVRARARARTKREVNTSD